MIQLTYEEIWKKIIESCNYGDPKYSYTLFKELMIEKEKIIRIKDDCCNDICFKCIGKQMSFLQNK